MPQMPSQLPSRYLAAFFPFLPANRLVRQCAHRSATPEDTPGEAGKAKGPLVFIDKERSALRIQSVSREALAAGLVPGLTLADARARVPHLVAEMMDLVADAAFLERMADVCDRYTPLVALNPPNGLILDITGCAHLFGGERAMRDDFSARWAKVGLDMVCAIASTPDTAAALARFGKKGVSSLIVPKGEEDQAVAGLPVAALGLGAEVNLALNRAGLVSLGDLAARPRAPLAARFGTELPTRLARLLGQEDISITPRRPLPACTVERRFAEPIGREEDVLATLAHLMEQVGELLEARGEGGRMFEASLFRTDGAVRRLRVETSLPTFQAPPVVRLFRERLGHLADPLDPGFGYDLIRLAVEGCLPVEQEQTSLDGHQLAEQHVAHLVDRLTTRLGSEAVVRFETRPTHIPERAAYEVPARDSLPAPSSTQQSHKAEDALCPVWMRDTAPIRPLHLFQHPQPIEALAEIPDGPPLKFRWRRVLHDIARAEGPERIATEWWLSEDGDHSTGHTRDYYRVEDTEGRRFWVFRDGLYAREAAQPCWFVHGLFA